MEEKNDTGSVPSRYQPPALWSSAPPALVASSAPWPAREQRRDQPWTSSLPPPRPSAHLELVLARATDSPGAEGRISVEKQPPSFPPSLSQVFIATQQEADFRPVKQRLERNDDSGHSKKPKVTLTHAQDSGAGCRAREIEAPERTKQHVDVEPSEGDFFRLDASASAEHCGSAGRRRRSSQVPVHQENAQSTLEGEPGSTRDRDAHPAGNQNGVEGSSSQQRGVGTVPSGRGETYTWEGQSEGQAQERGAQEETLLCGKSDARGAGRNNRVEDRREEFTNWEETTPTVIPPADAGRPGSAGLRVRASPVPVRDLVFPAAHEGTAARGFPASEAQGEGTSSGARPRTVRRHSGVSTPRAPASYSNVPHSWRSRSSILVGPPAAGSAGPGAPVPRGPSLSGVSSLLAAKELQTPFATAAHPFESFGAARALFPCNPSSGLNLAVAPSPPFPAVDSATVAPHRVPFVFGPQPVSHPCSFELPGVGAISFPPFRATNQSTVTGVRGASPSVPSGVLGAAPLGSCQTPVPVLGARSLERSPHVSPLCAGNGGSEPHQSPVAHSGAEDGVFARIWGTALRSRVLNSASGNIGTAGAADFDLLSSSAPVFACEVEPDLVAASVPKPREPARFPSLCAAVGSRLGRGPLVPETVSLPPSVRSGRACWRDEARLRVSEATGFATILGLLASSAISCIRRGHIPRHFRLLRLVFERFRSLSDDSRAVIRILGDRDLSDQFRLEQEALDAGLFTLPSATPRIRQFQTRRGETPSQGAEQHRTTRDTQGQGKREKEEAKRRREHDLPDRQSGSHRGPGKLARRTNESRATREGRERGTQRQDAGEERRSKGTVCRGRSGTRRSRRREGEGHRGNKTAGQRGTRRQKGVAEEKERLEDSSSDSEGVPRHFFKPGLPGNLSPRPPHPASSPEPPPVLSLPSPLCSVGKHGKNLPRRRYSADWDSDGDGCGPYDERASESDDSPGVASGVHRVDSGLCLRLGSGMMHMAPTDPVSVAASPVFENKPETPASPFAAPPYGGRGLFVRAADLSSCPQPASHSPSVVALGPLVGGRPQAQRQPVSVEPEAAMKSRGSAAQSGVVPESACEDTAAVEAGREMRGMMTGADSSDCADLPFFHPVLSSAYDPKTKDSRAYYSIPQRLGAPAASSASNLQGSASRPDPGDASLCQGTEEGGEACGTGEGGLRGEALHAHVPLPHLPSSVASASASRGGSIFSPYRKVAEPQSSGGPLGMVGRGGGESLPTRKPEVSLASAPSDHIGFPLSRPPLRGMSSVSYPPPPVTDRQSPVSPVMPSLGREQLVAEGPSPAVGLAEALPLPESSGNKRRASTGPTVEVARGTGRRGVGVLGLSARGRVTRQSGRRAANALATRCADRGAKARVSGPEGGRVQSCEDGEEGGCEREEDLQKDESEARESVENEVGQDATMKGIKREGEKGRRPEEGLTAAPRVRQGRGAVKRDDEDVPDAAAAADASAETHGLRPRGRSRSSPSPAVPAPKRQRVASEAARKAAAAESIPRTRRRGTSLAAEGEADGARPAKDVPITVEDSDPSCCREEARQDRPGAASQAARVDCAAQGKERSARPIPAACRTDELDGPEWSGKENPVAAGTPSPDQMAGERRREGTGRGGDSGGRNRDEPGPKRGECERLDRRPTRHGDVGKVTPGDRSQEATGFSSANQTGAGGLEATLPGFTLGAGGTKPKCEGDGRQYFASTGVASASLDGRRYGSVDCGEGTPSAGDAGQRGPRGGAKGAMSLVAFSFLAPEQGMSEQFWKQSFEVIDHWRAADEDADEEKIFTFASSMAVGALAADFPGGSVSSSPGSWGAGRTNSWGTKGEDTTPADVSRFRVFTPASGGGGCSSSSTLAHCGTPGTPGLNNDGNGLRPSPESRGRTTVSSLVAAPLSAVGAGSLRLPYGAMAASHGDEERTLTPSSNPTGASGASVPARARKTVAPAAHVGGAGIVCLPSLCHPPRSGPVPAVSTPVVSSSLSLLPAFSPSALQACGLHLPGMAAGVTPFSLARSGQSVNNGTQVVTVSLFPKEWLGRNGRLCRRSGMLKGCLRALRDVNLLEEDSALSVEAPLLLTRPSPNGGDGRLLIPRHTITLRIDHPFPAFISCSRPSNGDRKACSQNRTVGCVCPSCSACAAPQGFDPAGHTSCASSLSTASTTTHGSSSSSSRRNPRAGDKARQCAAAEGPHAGDAAAGEEEGTSGAVSARRASFSGTPHLGDGTKLSLCQGGEEGDRAGAEREEADTQHREGAAPHDSHEGLVASTPRDPRLLNQSGSGGNTNSSFNAAAASFGVLSGVLSGALAAVASSASPLYARGATGGFRPASSSFPTRQSSPLAARGTTPASGASGSRALGSKAENDVSLASSVNAGGHVWGGRGRSGDTAGAPAPGHGERAHEATDSLSGSTPSSCCGSSRTTSATSASGLGGVACAGCSPNSETALAGCGGGCTLVQGPPQQHILVRSKPAYLLLWRYGERGTSQDPKRKWYVVTPMFIRTKWFGRCFEFYSRFQQGQLDKYKLLVVDALNRVSPKRDAIVQAWCLAGCLEATLKELGVDYQVREVTEGPWQGFPEPTLTDEDQVIEGTLRLVTDPIDELETSYSSLLSEMSAGVGSLNSASSGFPSSFLSRQHSEALHSKANNEASCPASPAAEGVYGRNVAPSSLSPLGVSSPLASSLGAERVQARLGISSGTCFGRVDGGVAGGAQRSGRTPLEGGQPREDKAGEQGRRDRDRGQQGYLDGRGAKRRREEADHRNDGREQTQEREAKAEGDRLVEEADKVLNARLLASAGCTPHSAQHSHPLHAQRAVVNE
ncbi:conserved hypothetical protein [Neospora caninum Liverpool]|uniref:Uncharacterized protein n=1 Tax=Neospora caninum (strain Liverpool) TaxID=572307 RepID=F0V8U3_NEOCL|nr:conserved hypothetical protein [Neospora caninum Liverpool]CBZ50134.1 conserved hypothetical protein [Neospora caninum Liverpool]|eukprot:XP_003880169.1 conserved hypothetical protein [Neospora caninum Liverpool]